LKNRGRLPADSKLRKALPELWAWYGAHGYPDSHRPVRSALVLALVRRVSHLIQVAAKGWLGAPPDPTDPSDDIYLRLGLIGKRLKAAGLSDLAGQLTLEVDELLRWLAPAGTDEKRRDVVMKVYEASDPATKKEIFRQIPRLLEARDRGRPSSSKKLLWVKAYEKNIRNRTEHSWMEIAIKVCDCGKTKHTNRCRNGIRQGVRLLERLLKNYQIHLPLQQSSHSH
jgi:hypothetical protein